MLERPPVSCKSVVTDVVKTPDGVILVRDPHPAVNQALYLIAYRQRTGGQLGTGLVCHDSKKCPPWCADLTRGVEGSVERKSSR